MTSLERRHETRYQRRKAQREERRRERCSKYDDFSRVISYSALFRANQISRKNVCWKTSVQRYQMNLLRNIHNTHNALLAHQDISKGFVEFDTVERGKTRHIRSVHYSERVVQRSLCDNALVPMLTRGLIYDNGACLKGKGVDWAMDRLDAQLQKFYRANGRSNVGYVALFDFSGYFNGILHSVCFDLYKKVFTDESILWLLRTFVFPFGFPEVNGNWRKAPRPVEKGLYTGKSLGLGSQVSQITAVSYPNTLDHAIKQVFMAKWYGRYMDDGEILSKTAKEAAEKIEEVMRSCKPLGITVNKKKTHICKIDRWFRYLKTNHKLTETGKTLRHISRESVTRERRKLKKMAKWYAEGKIDLSEVKQAYGSWKGYALHRNAIGTIENMDGLYRSLFLSEPPKCKLKKHRRK